MTESPQAYITATGMIVDPQLIDTRDARLFPPFRVRTTQPLARALERGIVRPDRPVLVSELASSVIVLDKAQMSYYHTAQGELRGQPWMVCF